MSNFTTEEVLDWAMRHILIAASTTNAYREWSNDFTRSEIDKAFTEVASYINEKENADVFWKKVWELPVETKLKYGFCKWNENGCVIPLWIFQLLPSDYVFPDGEEKKCIDNDIRGGCVYKII